MRAEEDYLLVAIGGHEAGRIFPSRNGILRFEYAPRYEGPALSVCMRLAERPYEGRFVTNWFDGILPDDPDVRDALGARYGCAASDTFTLLAHIGWDAPGAVQVFPPDAREEVLGRRGAYQQVSDDEIARRIASLEAEPSATWELPDEHWSVGGMQSKFALARFDATWYRAIGSAATAHLIKPGVRGLPFQALDEAVTMQLAQACGLPAARCWMGRFKKREVLVVERYDRMVDGTGQVTRIHQEDLCQALGVSPARKYSFEGGPTSSAIMQVIEAIGDDRGRLDFLGYLIFNNLVGATDGHAKNYSILHFPRRSFLAPQYDVASALPYLAPHKTYRTALSIGGENRIGWLRGSCLAKAARAYGVDVGDLRQRTIDIGQALLDNVDAVIERNSDMEGIDEFASRFTPRLTKLVQTTLANVDRSGSDMTRPDFLA